jgi:hypothetical protein
VVGFCENGNEPFQMEFLDHLSDCRLARRGFLLKLVVVSYEKWIAVAQVICSLSASRDGLYQFRVTVFLCISKLEGLTKCIFPYQIVLQWLLY